MGHIHELIDFTVEAYIVYENSVLFIHHKKLNRWLTIGGHIELDENPEEALFREIEEECGIQKDQLTVLSDKPTENSQTQEFLYTPNLLDIHKISDTHSHVGIKYFIKSSTNELKLAELEHNDILWLTEDELTKDEYNLSKDLIFAAKRAITLAKN